MTYGIVPAIGKHVIAEEALAGGDEGVGVDKSADGGVVITALQVIEAGIGVVLVAAWDITVKSQHRRYHDYSVILAASLLMVKRTMVVIRKFCQLAGPLLSECIYGIALLDACFRETPYYPLYVQTPLICDKY